MRILKSSVSAANVVNSVLFDDLPVTQYLHFGEF